MAIGAGLWGALGIRERELLIHAGDALHFSQQQLRQSAEWFRDAEMWSDASFAQAAAEFLMREGWEPGVPAPANASSVRHCGESSSSLLQIRSQQVRGKAFKSSAVSGRISRQARFTLLESVVCRCAEATIALFIEVSLLRNS